MEEIKKAKQVITLTAGEALCANGIVDIVAFDENGIVLSTDSGRVIVEGEDLKIESLDKNGGNILITGKITGFFRSDAQVGKKGFFGRIFG